MIKFLYPFFIFLVLGSVLAHSVSATDFNQPITDQEKATFSKITEPISKMYNLFKYVLGIAAIFASAVAAFLFITGGSDVTKREKAKNLLMYIVIGLGVVWIAPLLVEYMTG